MKPPTHSFEANLRRTRAMLSASTAEARVIAVTGTTGDPAVAIVAGMLASAFNHSGEPCLSMDLRDISTATGVFTRADQFKGKVIVHCPALEESALALEIARRVDGFVLVIEIGRQRADVLERNINALRLSGGVILGAIPVQGGIRPSHKNRGMQPKTVPFNNAMVTELS
jgi:Mrp family chromosome partitioning ATPase